MISTKSVVASSDQRTFCTSCSAFFEHGLNLGPGGIMWQAWFFALPSFFNLGTKPLVVAGFLFFGLELGNDRR